MLFFVNEPNDLRKPVTWQMNKIDTAIGVNHMLTLLMSRAGECKAASQ
jgi:hypothetical protein